MKSGMLAPPTRKGPLVMLLVVLVAVIALVIAGARLLSDAANPGAPLARLELGDEFTKTVLPGVPGGRLSFWIVHVSEEGPLPERKVDMLRYEIELSQGEQVISTLSCDPDRATVYLRESHDGNRHEVEHDMDDCSAKVPSTGAIAVRARRVWSRRPERARIVKTELVIRP